MWRIPTLVLPLALAEYAREWAAWTLGWTNDPYAVAPLMTALNDDVAGARAKAAWAMGKLRIKASASRLQEMTEESNPLVRQYAAEALERLSNNRGKTPEGTTQ